MKPTTEDVAKWTWEVKAGLIKLFQEPTHTFTINQLQEFAALAYAAGAAAEREECAKVCEGIQNHYDETEWGCYPEMKSDAETGAGSCVSAIRARGEKNE